MMRRDERREGLQIADTAEGDDFAGNERLGDAQGACDRKPIAGRSPKRQVAACRMADEHRS